MQATHQAAWTRPTTQPASRWTSTLRVRGGVRGRRRASAGDAEADEDPRVPDDRLVDDDAEPGEWPWVSMLIHTCTAQMTAKIVQKPAASSQACDRRSCMPPV